MGPGVTLDHGGGGPGNGGPLETGNAAALNRGGPGPMRRAMQGQERAIQAGPSRGWGRALRTTTNAPQQAALGLMAEPGRGPGQAGSGADRLAAPHSAPPGHALHRRPARAGRGRGGFGHGFFIFFWRGLTPYARGTIFREKVLGL